MFFLEMGGSILRTGQVRPHGEWHFLIECGHWRFETADAILVGSEDGQQFIDGSFEQLNLGLIANAEILLPSHDLLVSFDSGMEFRTFSTSAQATKQWTQWLLYGPGDYSWVADGGGYVKCLMAREPVQ